MNTTKKTRAATETVSSLRDLSVGVWPFGGFVVYVRGAVLRETRHNNPRVFATVDDAVKAGKRARK